MAFCTEDKQTACLSYFFSLAFNLILEFFVVFNIGFSCIDDILIICLCKAGCFVDKEFVHSFLSHPCLCEIFSVTTEHNIGTTSRHVCSDGYGTLFTCLSNDFCFSFVILSVQYLVLYTFSLKHRGEKF